MESRKELYRWNIDEIVGRLGSPAEQREGAVLFRLGAAKLTIFPAACLVRYAAGPGDAGDGDTEVTLRRAQVAFGARNAVVFQTSVAGLHHELTVSATGELSLAVQLTHSR